MGIFILVHLIHITLLRLITITPISYARLTPPESKIIGVQQEMQACIRQSRRRENRGLSHERFDQEIQAYMR
jgi:hypothetical protein